MASEPFWLLAYHDPSLAVSPGEGMSPKQLRQQVKFAQLRAPFWDVLQQGDHVRQVIQHPDTTINDWPVKAIDYFKNQMKVGDLIVATEGNKRFRAIGRVAGPYSLAERETYRQKRPVEWLVIYGESVPYELIVSKAFTQLSIYLLNRHPECAPGLWH